MISGILSKILSELTLTSYPVFIKTIDISFLKKIFYRLFSFTFISLFFCDYNILQKYLFHKEGLLLSLYTFIHVLSSYKGFELLNGGVASSILYIYPLIILYFSNKNPIFIYIFILFGLLLLSFDHFTDTNYKDKNKDNKKDDTMTYSYGFICMLISAITEALIYFSILRIKTTNNWNHIFISYFIGFIFISGFFILNSQFKIINKENTSIKMNKTHIFALFFNIIGALFGYYLRFYSIDKLSYKLYAILSYLGIFLTYFYSYLFNNEKITFLNIIGSIIIILSNIYLLFLPE